MTPVGVFVNPTADDVNAATDAGISVAQIHGESDDWHGGLMPGVEVIRAVHLADGRPDAIEPDVPDHRILLDAHDPVRHGGTGQTIDWSRARLVAQARQVILAGGLTPENVRQAIGEVRPFAVDVSSGVEMRPGVKDHARYAGVHRGSERYGSHDKRHPRGLDDAILTRAATTARTAGASFPRRWSRPSKRSSASILRRAQDPAFAAELTRLLTQYAGRPTPLWEARRLAKPAAGRACF